MATPDRSLPVAVFDSGVGGLTVLHECLVSLPHEDFLYLGDTARFPYGDRSADQLAEFAAEVDANVVMTGDGGLVEVQATAERTPLSRASLDELLALAAAGIERLKAAQQEAVGAVTA